ncbi:hypothetical protein CEE86_13955 [Lactobacillus crispatus]|nr:hypothetical protein CEE86_13955 [Lactobacillus crispatus]
MDHNRKSPSGVGAPAPQTVRSQASGVSAREKTGLSGKDGIAIIGMSGRFPMADDVSEFWRNLVDGRDCISEIPKERWDWRAVYGDPVREANKTNVKWGGFIRGIDEFDPLFFGISPREAELMDPQQRLVMTYVWKAIEDAGLSVATVFQYFSGGSGRTFHDDKKKINDVAEALAFADRMKQPEHSTLYF